jgi:hypothetical protein
MLAKAYKEKGGKYTGPKTEGAKNLEEWGKQQ